MGNEYGEKKEFIKALGRAKNLAVLSRNAWGGKEGLARGNVVNSI